MYGVEIQHALDDIFDQALVYHGFTDYMRDYELIVHMTADPRTGIAPTYRRYLFKYCVSSHVETTVAPETWKRSLDDRLIVYDTGVDLDGYVWGVKWQCLYPGGKVITDSAVAQRWGNDLGMEFHEVRVEGNGHALTLVCANLEVTQVTVG